MKILIYKTARVKSINKPELEIPDVININICNKSTSVDTNSCCKQKERQDQKIHITTIPYAEYVLFDDHCKCTVKVPSGKLSN